MDGSGGHYINSHKPSMERQVQNDLIHMYKSLKSDLIEVKCTKEFARGKGGETGGWEKAEQLILLYS